MPLNPVLSGRYTTDWDQMRGALVFLLLTGLAVAACAFAEARSWRRERDTLCTAAAPLVAAKANSQSFMTIGQAFHEYRGAAAREVEQQFGVESDKGISIRKHLKRDGSLLVFPGSNAVMLVYLDHSGLADKAECFLQ